MFGLVLEQLAHPHVFGTAHDAKRHFSPQAVKVYPESDHTWRGNTPQSLSLIMYAARALSASHLLTQSPVKPLSEAPQLCAYRRIARSGTHHAFLQSTVVHSNTVLSLFLLLQKEHLFP